MALWLSSGTPADPSLLGGKAANLVRLVTMGMPVPQGFCLTTRAYDSFIAYHDLSALISEASLPEEPDLGYLEQISGRIGSAIARLALPPGLEAELSVAYRSLCRATGENQAAVAVRSSATTEDSATASFAGQHDSFLNVSGLTDLIQSVKMCWTSLWSSRALHYRLTRGTAVSTAHMAVVVQQMIDAEVSAVTFTANPVSGDATQMVVNLAWGLGEAIVSGLVTPDSYIIGKDPLSIIEASVGEKDVMVVPSEHGGVEEVAVAERLRETASLSDSLVLANAALCLDVERQFGYPVDVESAYGSGQWYILQARPITT